MTTYDSHLLDVHRQVDSLEEVPRGSSREYNTLQSACAEDLPIRRVHGHPYGFYADFGTVCKL